MPQILLVLWLIGVGVFLLPVFAGFWQVRRLRRSAIPWGDGQDLVRSLASVRGVRRRIDVVLHDAVAGPLTCGVVRPSIILPVASRNWDEASLRRSLRHELEHVARWDFLTNCVSRMICAAYWFHPLVWSAWRRASVGCRSNPACSTSSSAGRLAGGGVTLEEFATSLPMHLRSYGGRQAFDRPIVDRTGLAGRFDFRLEWEQDVPANSPSAPGRPFVSVLESAAPRFLAALQQQLGLKIESQMAPAPVLVIDSIEEPSEK